jgi:hypothetical protein
MPKNGREKPGDAILFAMVIVPHDVRNEDHGLIAAQRPVTRTIVSKGIGESAQHFLPAHGATKFADRRIITWIIHNATRTKEKPCTEGDENPSVGSDYIDTAMMPSVAMTMSNVTAEMMNVTINSTESPESSSDEVAIAAPHDGKPNTRPVVWSACRLRTPTDEIAHAQESNARSVPKETARVAVRRPYRGED